MGKAKPLRGRYRSHGSVPARRFCGNDFWASNTIEDWCESAGGRTHSDGGKGVHGELINSRSDGRLVQPSTMTPPGVSKGIGGKKKRFFIHRIAVIEQRRIGDPCHRLMRSEVTNELRQEGFTAQILGGDSMCDHSGVRGYPGVCLGIIGSTGESAKCSDQ